MKLATLALALLASLATDAAFAQAAPDPVTPVDVINAMESNGVHPGYRRNHSKGLCVAGEFKPTAEAKKLSASNIFAGSPVKVVGRFSDAGGNPQFADNTPDPRGFALQFQPADGSTTNMSMLDVPVFPVPTPEGFYQLMTVKSPDALAAFKQKYPRSAPFFAFLGKNGVPESFATADYHSLSAFKLTNDQGKSQFVRWNFLSKQGVHFLSADEAKAKSPDFLAQALQDELKKGPQVWVMRATLANSHDSLVDPSMPWTGPHRLVSLGTLTITQADTDGSGACNPINFDPTNVAKGIEPSDDPVLKFRSPAYAISFGKRTAEK